MFSNWLSTVRDHMKVPKSPEAERQLQQQQQQQQQEQLQQQLQQQRSQSVSTPSTQSEQGEQTQDKSQFLEPTDFKLHRTHSTPTHRERNPSISDAIPIQRRRSLFGIASDSADDYVQKDLISSSWS